MKSISLLSFLFISFCLSGQNISTSTIGWNSTSAFNVAVGELVEESATIISYADHIDWKAADGTVKHSFSILESNGSWTNISNNGQIIYEIDNHGKRGTAQFKKDASGISIKFIVLTDESPEIYELTITSTQLF